MQTDADRDFIRFRADFFTDFLYSGVSDTSELQRSARTIWLELKSENVAKTCEKVTGYGLVHILDIPNPHLYFQAPGGHCMHLVGSDGDLSLYEGTDTGPHIEKINQALNKL